MKKIVLCFMLVLLSSCASMQESIKTNIITNATIEYEEKISMDYQTKFDEAIKEKRFNPAINDNISGPFDLIKNLSILMEEQLNENDVIAWYIINTNISREIEFIEKFQNYWIQHGTLRIDNKWMGHLKTKQYRETSQYKQLNERLKYLKNLQEITYAIPYNIEAAHFKEETGLSLGGGLAVLGTRTDKNRIYNLMYLEVFQVVNGGILARVNAQFSYANNYHTDDVVYYIETSEKFVDGQDLSGLYCYDTGKTYSYRAFFGQKTVKRYQLFKWGDYNIKKYYYFPNSSGIPRIPEKLNEPFKNILSIHKNVE